MPAQALAARGGWRRLLLLLLLRTAVAAAAVCSTEATAFTCTALRLRAALCRQAGAQDGCVGWAGDATRLERPFGGQIPLSLTVLREGFRAETACCVKAALCMFARFSELHGPAAFRDNHRANAGSIPPNAGQKEVDNPPISSALRAQQAQQAASQLCCKGHGRAAAQPSCLRHPLQITDSRPQAAEPTLSSHWQRRCDAQPSNPNGAQQPAIYRPMVGAGAAAQRQQGRGQGGLPPGGAGYAPRRRPQPPGRRPLC